MVRHVRNTRNLLVFFSAAIDSSCGHAYYNHIIFPLMHQIYTSMFEEQ